MNKLLILAIIMLTNVVASAQTDGKTLSKRELKKKTEAMQDSISYASAVQALNNKDFVVEVDYLNLQRGGVVNVSSTTNFVSLLGDDAVVQIAPYNSAPGLNGIGGITMEGKASGIESKTDKKGNINFRMTVMGPAASVMVEIFLTKGTNRVSVDVSPNTRPGTITLNGNLIPTEQSEVYKGTSRL